MKNCVLVFGLAILVGIYLVYRGGWPIVIIGILSIASGILYTGGPMPLGYLGLGDLFVLIFLVLLQSAALIMYSHWKFRK
jgi:1,4-dihydroxy-2-naphthoate octaprenyltransferase